MKNLEALEILQEIHLIANHNFWSDDYKVIKIREFEERMRQELLDDS